MRKFIQINDENPSISDLFDKFIYFKKATNKSEDTIKYYYACLKFFGNFFDIDKKCSCVNEDTYLDYSTYLLKLDIEKITVNTRLRGMKTFLNYGMKRRIYTKFLYATCDCSKKS